jgi:hypothetical protein
MSDPLDYTQQVAPELGARRPKRMLSEWEIKQALDKGRLHQVVAEAMGDEPEEPTDDFFHTLRSAHRDHWIFSDPVATKKLRDMLLDAQSARQTSSADIGLLRQATPGSAGRPGDRPMRENPDMEYLQDPARWNAARRDHEF